MRLDGSIRRRSRLEFHDHVVEPDEPPDVAHIKTPDAAEDSKLAAWKALKAG